MNRSVSGPSFSTNSKSHLTSLSQNTSSIDLSTVDRESLPIGVSRTFGSRMKLDARGAPALLELRMNYRNLLNEFQVHDGKLVSNQFALLRPRPKATLQKPKALEYPPGVNKAVFRKAALLRSKQLDIRSTRPATREEDERPGVEEKVEDEGSPRSKPDPTLQKEVREIARNAKVQATHGSMEYPPNSGNGLPIDRIPRALEALSYLSPDPKRIEDSLQTLLYRSSADQPLALDEFAVVIHHFEVHRAQQIKAQFNQLDEDDSGAIDKAELRRLLWDTGYSVNRDTLDEIFEEVDKDKSGSVELKEFELVLKIVYDRFGFSRSEVKAFYTLFDRYDADLSGELSADELAGALGWCGHPTSIAEARDIIERYLEKSIQSISRPEFLRIMRCVAEEEIEEFRALFSAMDDDDSGFLDMHELSELFFKLGYTIHSSVIEEAVHGLFPAGVEDGIIFEDCVHVLAYIRSNEGFSKEEAGRSSVRNCRHAQPPEVVVDMAAASHVNLEDRVQAPLQKVPGDGWCLFHAVARCQRLCHETVWYVPAAARVYLATLEWLWAELKTGNAESMRKACVPESGVEVERHRSFLERRGAQVHAATAPSTLVLWSKLLAVLEGRPRLDPLHHGSAGDLWAICQCFGLEAVIWSRTPNENLWVRTQTRMTDAEAHCAVQQHRRVVQVARTDIGATGHFDLVHTAVVATQEQPVPGDWNVLDWDAICREVGLRVHGKLRVKPRVYACVLCPIQTCWGGICEDCEETSAVTCATCRETLVPSGFSLAELQKLKCKPRRQGGPTTGPVCYRCEGRAAAAMKGRRCKRCGKEKNRGEVRDWNPDTKEGTCRACAAQLKALPKNCSQCGEALPNKAAPGTWCRMCAFPPCQGGCGRPRPQKSSYHATNLAEWICGACAPAKCVKCGGAFAEGRRKRTEAWCRGCAYPACQGGCGKARPKKHKYHAKQKPSWTCASCMSKGRAREGCAERRSATTAKRLAQTRLTRQRRKGREREKETAEPSRY
eukprot:s1066_g1.t1